MNPTPNILMILVDERRADALGCFGNGIIRTPNLDRLAAGGTRFSQCMVTQPTCTPCRASLLTGCFPSALRSRMVGCETPDVPRFLPRVLGAAGYRTASIGKTHLVPQAWEPEAIEKTSQADGTYDYYGFREVELVNGHGDRCFGPNFTPWVERRLAECGASRHPRKPLCGIPDCYEWPLPPELHSTPYIADRTTEFLRDAASHERPFFLHCSFPDPHHPFTVPEPYASMYDPDDMPDPLPPPDDDSDPPPPVCAAYRNEDTDAPDHVIGTPRKPYPDYTNQDWRVVRAITAGMVTQLDDGIGRVLDALAATGLAENTIVVFASDHGDYLGDHGLFGKGFHYDSAIRTPLILRGPGIPEGRGIDQPASLLDLAPTLLELADIAEPEAMQGLSMVPGLANPPDWPRTAALTENDDDMARIRMRTLTTAEWKLTLYAGREFGELYNRRTDPDERTNLWSAPDHATVRADLTTQLADHMLCAVDGANGRVQPPRTPVAKHVPQRGE